MVGGLRRAPFPPISGGQLNFGLMASGSLLPPCPPRPSAGFTRPRPFIDFLITRALAPSPS